MTAPGKTPAKTRHQQDVCVVGQGIIGLLCAYELAKAGMKVCLVEGNFHAAALPDAGLVSPIDQPALAQPFLAYAHQAWETLQQQIDMGVGFAEKGAAYLAATDGQWQRVKALHARHPEHDCDLVENPAHLAEVFGHPLATGVRGGAVAPDAASIDSERALETLRRELVALGVRIWGTDPTTALLIEENTVKGVRTAYEDIPAEITVLAAELPLQSLSAGLQVKMPLRPARAHVVEAGITQKLPETVMLCPKKHGFLLCRQMRSGQVLLMYDGLVDQAQATWHHTPDPQAVDAIWHTAGQLMPTLQKARRRRVRTFTQGVTPDGLPYIGRPANVEGLLVAAGFGRARYAYGPGAALVIAALAAGQNPEVDTTPFSPDRFLLAKPQEVIAQLTQSETPGQPVRTRRQKAPDNAAAERDEQTITAIQGRKHQGTDMAGEKKVRADAENPAQATGAPKPENTPPTSQVNPVENAAQQGNAIGGATMQQTSDGTMGMQQASGQNAPTSYGATTDASDDADGVVHDGKAKYVSSKKR